MERVVELRAFRAGRADGPDAGPCRGPDAELEGVRGPEGPDGLARARLAEGRVAGERDGFGRPGGFGDSSVFDDAGGCAAGSGGRTTRREPCVSLYDLLPRDLTVTGEIVHALLMVREVLSCALPGQGAWRGPLVALFDAAHRRSGPFDPAFPPKVLAFKNFLERFITRENVRDLGTAVVILNLIARSPAERQGRASQAGGRPRA